MATKYSEGLRIDYTPDADVSSGDVIVLEDLVGIATADIDADELGTLDVEGVFTMAKGTGSGTAIVAGELVYWDDDEDEVTTESSGNVLLGKAIEAAASTVATVKVKLTP